MPSISDSLVGSDLDVLEAGDVNATHLRWQTRGAEQSNNCCNFMTNSTMMIRERKLKQADIDAISYCSKASSPLELAIS